jgi:nucleoside-diphosphate-sugar epimerase
MHIAVTGGSGRLGRVLIDQLLEHGHTVRSIDRVPPTEAQSALLALPSPPLSFTDVDMNVLDNVVEAIRGVDAVIHLAAFPGPHGHPPGLVYNNNTIISHNVLNAASMLDIRKICMASSINAIGHLASKEGRYDYFPVDERHPSYNEDDYSLSKWVLEQQGDSFARRNHDLTISSMRFSGLPDTPVVPDDSPLETKEAGRPRGLWSWTLISEAARACELAVKADFKGHEVFYITAPRTSSSHLSVDLVKHAYPEVPIRGDISGHRSLFDSSKAGRLLGWFHADV